MTAVSVTEAITVIVCIVPNVLLEAAMILVAIVTTVKAPRVVLEILMVTISDTGTGGVEAGHRDQAEVVVAIVPMETARWNCISRRRGSLARTLSVPLKTAVVLAMRPSTFVALFEQMSLRSIALALLLVATLVQRGPGRGLFIDICCFPRLNLPSTLLR